MNRISCITHGKLLDVGIAATATTTTKEKEPLESHNRQKHLVKLGSDGSVLDGSNQEITRLNFGVQHDNNVSIIIADFSALS